MRNVLLFLVVCVGLQVWVGCGDDKSTNPANTPDITMTASVSGGVHTLYNTWGYRHAPNVTMVFVDSKLDSHTVVTDELGQYAVEGLAPGSVEVSLSSTQTLFEDPVSNQPLKLYLPKDTTILVAGDTVIDFGIRRLEIAFGDFGYSPQYWTWEYGVRNEDGKYIFWYDVRGSDMRMVQDAHIPDGWAKIGYAVHGQALPSGASYMDVGFLVDGEPAPAAVSPIAELFTTTEAWYERQLGAYVISYFGHYQIVDDVIYTTALDLRLTLEYRRQTASSIRVGEILIYYY